MSSSLFSKVDRGSIDELQKLVTVKGEYTAFSRILFPDDRMKKPDLFRSDVLAKVKSSNFSIILTVPILLNPGRDHVRERRAL